jgi:hypothetical protein
MGASFRPGLREPWRWTGFVTPAVAAFCAWWLFAVRLSGIADY